MIHSNLRILFALVLSIGGAACASSDEELEDNASVSTDAYTGRITNTMTMLKGASVAQMRGYCEISLDIYCDALNMQSGGGRLADVRTQVLLGRMHCSALCVD